MFAKKSDRRAKESISKIDNSIDKIMSLDGYLFNYIDDPTKTPTGGVMAQDVEGVMPSAVIEIDGVKHVNYIMIIGLLVEAVKEFAKSSLSSGTVLELLTIILK